MESVVWLAGFWLVVVGLVWLLVLVGNRRRRGERGRVEMRAAAEAEEEYWRQRSK